MVWPPFRLLIFAINVCVASNANLNANGLSTSALLPRSAPLSTKISAAVMLSAWPAEVTLGTYVFDTAVFDGMVVWLIPRSASHIVYINPSAADEMVAIPLPVPDPALPTVTQKFVAAAYDGEGTIWVPPYQSGYFMTINVTSRNAAKLTHSSLSDAAWVFHGAAYDGDFVWCAPYIAPHLLRIDRRGKNGTQIMSSPFNGTNAANSSFTGVVFDGSRMWFVPGMIDNVLAIDVETLNKVSIPVAAWPPGVWHQTQHNFVGGCFDGARVWLAPDGAAKVVYIDVTTTTIMSVSVTTSDDVPMGSSPFRTAFFDGARVWLMPRNAKSFIAIDPGPGTPTWRAYDTSVSGRSGGVSDGRSLYVVPFLNTTVSPLAVLKLPLNLTAATATSSLSFPATASTTRTSSTTVLPSMTSSRSQTTETALSHTLSASQSQSLTQSNAEGTPKSGTASQSNTKSRRRSWSPSAVSNTFVGRSGSAATLSSTRNRSRSAAPATTSISPSLTVTNTAAGSRASIVLTITVPPPHVPLVTPALGNIVLSMSTVTMPTSAVVQASAGLAALSGSPGAAMQAARAMSILALSACHFQHDVAVSFPLSVWPGFEVGPGRQGSYYRGAVVANVATLAGVCMLLLAGSMLKGAMSKAGVIGGMSAMRLPGGLAAPLGFLLPGTVATSVATAAHGAYRDADVPLAALGLAVTAGSIVMCVVAAVAVPRRFGCVVTRSREVDESSSSRVAVVLRFFEAPWGSPKQWGARDDTQDCGAGLGQSDAMMLMFRPLFQRYRVECPWYYGFDATLTYLVAVAQGSMPEGRTKCLAAMGAVLVPCVVAFAGVVVIRPDGAASKLLLHGAATGVTLLSACLALIGIVTDSDDVVTASRVCALGASAVSLTSSVLSLLLQLVQLSRKRRRRAVDFPPERQVLLLPPLPKAAEWSSGPPPPIAPDRIAYSSEPTSALTCPINDPLHRQCASPTTTSTSGPDEKRRYAPAAAALEPVGRFVLHRTEEGQRLHDELTALFSGSLTTAAPGCDRVQPRTEERDGFL